MYQFRSDMVFIFAISLAPLPPYSQLFVNSLSIIQKNSVYDDSMNIFVNLVILLTLNLCFT